MYKENAHNARRGLITAKMVPLLASVPRDYGPPRDAPYHKKTGAAMCIVFSPSYVLGSEAWEEYSSGLLSLIKDFVLSVWEERLCGEHANVHQSHSFSE